VIKVEPFHGEHLRSCGDMGGAALPFAMLNSNKKPVTLNLKTEKGRDLLREMVARADILVENFAPGVADRLGIGPYDLLKINPRLIYGSSSGYGKSGPYHDYPTMDLVMQAMCGVINSTGFPDQPPVKSGAALCDFSAGIHLYAAITTALYERERTGKGRVVEVSMQDATYASLASHLGMVHARGAAAPARTGQPARRARHLALQRLSDDGRLRGAQRAGRPPFPRDPGCHGPIRPQGGSALSHPRDASR
jgi:CoA:oxalate CoA-transferase